MGMRVRAGLREAGDVGVGPFSGASVGMRVYVLPAFFLFRPCVVRELRAGGRARVSFQVAEIHH